MLVLCIFLFFAFSVELGVTELTATSTHEMRRVLEGEDHLLTDFRIYIKVVEQKLNSIRIIVDDAMKRQQEAMMDPVAFVSNPLNSLPMLRRMRQDAPSLYSYLKLEEGKDLQQIADYNLQVLTDLDLEYAVKGLLRIQQVYNLDERDMAKGLLTQKQYNAKLNTLDCVCLARHLRKQGENQQAATWLKIALEQYEETPEPVLKLMNTDRAVILRELGMIQVQRGDFLGSWATFEKVFECAERKEHKQEAEASMMLAQQHLSHLSNCRGQRQLPVSSSIRCQYNTINSAFLRLAPLKQEQLSIDPDIVLYHNVIYDDEIADTLRLTKPYLTRALVGTGRSDFRRSAMNAGLTQDASLPIERLNRRIKDMTGFELDFNKDLDVINYGLAGQYYLHYDCGSASDEFYLENNRIATVLLYLTDVQLGGLTSFPRLKLGVQPTKGAALMWHNVNNAAECDKRTLHAACPVLQGNRWVAAQWFQLTEQKLLVCSAKQKLMKTI